MLLEHKADVTFVCQYVLQKVWSVRILASHNFIDFNGLLQG
jgi:hypothetical protein